MINKIFTELVVYIELEIKEFSFIKNIMDILVPGGIIVIVSYYGHKGSLNEIVKLSAFVQDIDSKKYTVIKSEFINLTNFSPILITNEKSLWA